MFPSQLPTQPFPACAGVHIALISSAAAQWRGSPNTLVHNRTGSIIPLQSVFRMPGLIGRRWDLHPQLEFYCSSQLTVMLKSLGRTCAISSVWSCVLAGHFQDPTACCPQLLAGKVHGYGCSCFALTLCRLQLNRSCLLHGTLAGTCRAGGAGEAKDSPSLAPGRGCGTGMSGLSWHCQSEGPREGLPLG